MNIKQVCLEAVQKAGTILMENIGKIETISLKQKNDYVTNVDIEAENAIKQIIKINFPNHSIVAEESEIEKKNSEYTWYIDPISSTQNYMHGLPHFATVISVNKEGQTIIAAVLDPFFNELFYAEKGKGAYLYEKRISISSIDKLSKSLLSIVIQTKGEGNKEKGLKYFSDLIPHISSFRRLGSLALELCYIAAGRLEGQVFMSNDIFAIPAGKLILEEAGGLVTDFAGKAWNLKSTSIIATNGKIQAEIIKLIN